MALGPHSIEDRPAIFEGTPTLPPSLGDNLDLTQLRADPLRFLLENTARFGDAFRYTAEGWSAVVLNRPDLIRHVLHADHTRYSKEGTPDLMMLRPMLGDGLMTSEGASWSRQRAVSQPSFGNARIATYAGAIQAAVSSLLQSWERNASTGEPIDLESEMSRLTLDVICRSLFGSELGGDSVDFGAAVGVMNEFMGHFDPNDFSRMMQFQAAVLQIESIVDRIVAQRRAAAEPGDDLLAALMQDRRSSGETDIALRNRIFTFLMAGHETTAKSLTWALYLLDRHDGVRERLTAEIETVLGDREPGADDLDRLPYTWMTLQESMRVYPPVWLMSRVCRQADRVGEFVIAPGTLVIVSPYAMHHHPGYWPDPERFDPERFLPEKAERHVPYSYFPFSGGPRSCIGRRLATLEAVMVLASIVRRFRLRLVPGHPVEPEALVTLRPRFGMPTLVQSLRTRQDLPA